MVKLVINIGFLKYTLFKDVPEFYAKYSLLNEKTYRKYSDKISVRVLDLTRTDLATESNVYMDDAAQTLYELNADDSVRQQCEARRRAMMEEKHKLEMIEQLTADKSKLTDEINKLTNEKEALLREKEEWTGERENLVS